MRKISIIFIIIMLFICSSCSKENTENTINYEEAYKRYSEELVELNDIELIQLDINKVQTNIYYKDVNNYIVPVMRQIPKQDAIAKSAIMALINNDANRIELRHLGLSPVLPEGIECELALKEDNLMKINFNNAILSINKKEDEECAVQAIVYTLTEFDTVDKVQILVNNEIVQSLTNGTPVNEPLTRNNINSLNNNVEGEYIKATFYSFINISKEYTYYIPVTKNISKDEKNINNIVKEQILINEGFENEKPDKFVIDNIITEADIVYISISSELDNEDDYFAQYMKAMCLTLGQIEDINTVKLVIENDEVEDMKILTYSIPTYANVH